METEKQLMEALQEAFRGEIEKILAQAAKEAATKVEREVRMKAAEIAATIVTNMSIDRYERGIRIYIDFQHTQR